jgi:hypothetical protein
MGDRLEQEVFTTLDIHQAIAEPRNLFRLQHSTAVVSAKGDTMAEGIVLDPWRYGGFLYWSLVPDDPRYDWEEKDLVLARQKAKRGGKSG